MYYLFESEEYGMFAVQAESFGIAWAIAEDNFDGFQSAGIATEWEVDAMGLDVY